MTWQSVVPYDLKWYLVQIVPQVVPPNVNSRMWGVRVSKIASWPLGLKFNDRVERTQKDGVCEESSGLGSLRRRLCWF